MSRPLHSIQVANVKDVIYEGLKKKIDELGDLSIPFDISLEYPTRETFSTSPQGDHRHRRRVVVKRITETVKHYAIGHVVGGETNLDTLEETLVQGWVDNNTIEVSVWSPDSKDRDNLMSLVKLWMLELEQDIHQGNIILETPFFFNRELFQVRYVRSYEDSNRDWKTATGVIYIGSLIFEVSSPFFHKTNPEYLEKYKAHLLSEVVNCITTEE